MKIIAAIILLVIAPLATGQDLSHWEGHYSGELRSENVSGMVNTFHMELVIEYENDSTYKWVIIYGEEGDSLRQERNYVIRRTSTENHFILDEQNSILLDFDLIGNSFYSIFEKFYLALFCEMIIIPLTRKFIFYCIKNQ